jgi:hypothetical protein
MSTPYDLASSAHADAMARIHYAEAERIRGEMRACPLGSPRYWELCSLRNDTYAEGKKWERVMCQRRALADRR